MRHKRQIQVLTNKGKDVPLPKHDYQFTTYTSMLREVLEENFDYSVHKSLEYDDYDQVFWVTLKVDGLMTHQLRDEWPSRDRIGMTLSFKAMIDPRADMMQQLYAIKEQLEHMKERHLLLQALLYKHEHEKEKTS